MAGLDDGVSFQKCTSADAFTIQSNIFRERMNPLGLDHSRFLGATKDGELIGFGQVKNLGSEENPVLEMSSVVVMDQWRGQGVGTALIKKLAEEAEKAFPGEKLHLLTLGRRKPFYERCGWREADPAELPLQLRVELGLGMVVARVVAKDRCLGMVKPP